MNTKSLGLTLTLALALALALITLGYVNPAFAAKPDCNATPSHKSCKDDGGDGDGKTETVFLVEMTQGGLPNDPDDGSPPEGLVTTATACGSTKGELHLGVVFSDDCWVTNDACYTSGPTGCPGILRLWYVQVNLNKSNVKIGFLPDDHNHVFVTDYLEVTIIGGPPSAFTVEVNQSVDVEMNHNPGKGDLVGPIAIGNIVYTPIE